MAQALSVDRYLPSPEPDRYDDPLDLSNQVQPYTVPGEPIAPLPTGISDEEDAQRYIALQLNPALMFCTNCEVNYESDICPRCLSQLQPPGTPPLKSRRKHT